MGSMRLHRFYINPKTQKLVNKFWLQDAQILNQWQKVLRYRAGQEVVLFDGIEHERLYRITKFEPRAADLELVTDMVRKLPSKDMYLAWALLKKDKNDWVMQKCTELGVNHFIPLVTERCEKTGFNMERAKKIVIEASEQCGRSNIPTLREPISIEALLQEFTEKIPVMVCEQEGQPLSQDINKAAILVGPEGGWSDIEQALFKKSGVSLVSMGDFTHRAETASVAVISKIM